MRLIKMTIRSFPEHVYPHVDHGMTELEPDPPYCFTPHALAIIRLLIFFWAERELSQRNTNYDKLGENCISRCYSSLRD